jgi:anti-sigma factor RsiW
MNCENYQELISDLVDGVLTTEDCQRVELHLSTCPGCAEAHGDLRAIVEFCRGHRGEYEAVPNERALWLRISNTIESEASASPHANIPSSAGWWFRLMNRSWQLSFPQLAGAVAVLILLVSVATIVSVRGLSGRTGIQTAGLGIIPTVPVEERHRQQQQAIAYWNERVEMNKARWNPQLRETFERNMSVIDAAVNNSMKELRQNPHDEISEEILNDALNDKVALLKEFSDL